MTKVTLFAILFVFATNAMANEVTKPSPTTAAAESGGDKLDLKQLEDKYWSAKDTDFSVIQNRSFSKDHRYFVSLEYGTLINDAYSSGKIYSFATGYYFNEHWGIQLARDQQSSTDNSATSSFASQFNAKPNYNVGQDYNSVNVLWVPMYAKMSVLDKQIWYFDLQLGLGLGLVDYQSQIQPSQGSNMSQSSPGANFDVTSHLFFSRNWAVRFDMKNVWASEDLQRYNNAGQSNRDMGSSTNWDTKLMVGITYFFGAGVNAANQGH